MAATQDDAGPLGLAHQKLQGLVIKTAIGGMGNGFGLNGRINQDPLKAALLDRPAFNRNTYRSRKKLFHSLRTNPFAPAGHG